MTSLSSTRRKRTALMLAVNLLVLVGVGGLMYAGAQALRRYEGAKDTSKSTIPVPVTPVGMLATVDAFDRLSSVTVFVMKPLSVDGDTGQPIGSPPGGSIVSVPISADTAGGLDGQRVPLTEVYSASGAEALTLAVESTLSITIDQSIVVTPDELTTLLDPVAPIQVVLPSTVETTDNGSTVAMFPKGELQLSGKQASIIINARVDGMKEIAREPNIEAVWQGIAATIGDGKTTAAAGVPMSFEHLLTQVFAGPTMARGLPVRTLPASEIPEGKDVDELDRAEAVMVFASIAPSAMSAAAPGLMFRIEAPPGPGYDAKVKYTVEALLYLGANVQQVYLNGPLQEKTVVQLYDERFAGDVAGIETLFGSVETAKPATRIAGIDVVIQLGTSFLDDTTSGDTMPSTTTTTTEP